ncbi:MAG: TolC family protein, partial [Bryobacterales bacterium]|nr:TolC family protein [Bryobacterales bacterium]
MNRRRAGAVNRLLFFLLLLVPAQAETNFLRTYLERFHPNVIQERDVAGLEARISNGKLVLHLDDFIALVLKNSTDIRLTQLDVYTATDAVTAAQAPFDPLLVFSFNATRNISRQFNQINGAATLNSLNQTSHASYQQTLGAGPTVSANFNAVRSSSNNQFNFFNPSISDVLSVNITQPLLQGRGNLRFRAPLQIARTQLVITSQQDQARIADTVSAASQQYWESIRARDNIRVQEQSLALAQKSYDRDKQALELGALSRLDIFQSESTVAQRKLDLIQAQYAYKESLDTLRRLIGADLKPQTRYIDISLEDDPSVMPAFELPPVEQAVAKAMRDRPELSAAGKLVSIDEINARAARNSLQPQLDLTLSGGSAGLGGNQIPVAGILGSAPPIAYVRSGLGDSLHQLLSFNTPFYGAGLTLGLPIRSSAAQAQLSDALVNRTRDRYNARQIEQQIVLQVKTANNEVELAREAI